MGARRWQVVEVLDMVRGMCRRGWGGVIDYTGCGKVEVADSYLGTEFIGWDWLKHGEFYWVGSLPVGT